MKLSTREMKINAVNEALKLVQNGMILGLGTGSTAELMVEALGQRIREQGLKIEGAVATSAATARLAAEQGIAIIELNQLYRDRRPPDNRLDFSNTHIDLTLDGADEIYLDESDHTIDLVKGRGGAMLAEKIVSRCSKKLVIMADESKLVTAIGQKAPIPVEVIPYALESTFYYLLGLNSLLLEDDDSSLLLKPKIRTNNGEIVVTEQGNNIIDIDLKVSDELDAYELEDYLSTCPGIVETGLFLTCTDQAIIGRKDGAIQIFFGDFMLDEFADL